MSHFGITKGTVPTYNNCDISVPIWKGLFLKHFGTWFILLIMLFWYIYYLSIIPSNGTNTRIWSIKFFKIFGKYFRQRKCIWYVTIWIKCNIRDFWTHCICSILYTMNVIIHEFSYEYKTAARKNDINIYTISETECLAVIYNPQLFYF